jgi:uncharacterized protein YidB (DUF937 family)
MGAVDTARQNATLREEFLRRGLAPGDTLDRIGWVSHDDLDLWERAGVLELGVASLEEAWELQEKAWGLGLKHGEEFNRFVIRARGGRFGGTIGGEPVKPQTKSRIRQNITSRVARAEPQLTPRPRDAPIAKLKGRRGGVKGKKFKVYATEQPAGPRDPYAHLGKPERMGWQQFAAEKDSSKKIRSAGKTRLERKAAQASAAATAAARGGDHVAAAQHHAKAVEFTRAANDPAQQHLHGIKELYKTRTKRLEKRIKRGVAKAGEAITPAAGGTRGPHDLSAAEVHFNDAGRVSQKTLLAYAEEACHTPTTAEMYRNKDGEYHPSRRVLHAHIIDMLLRQHEGTLADDQGLSADKPYLQAPKGAPQVIFTGGGYASGKGGILRRLKRDNQWPPDAMLIDPDLIKAELPEFQLAAMTDPEANLRVYAEAWDIAQEAMKQAQERGLNVVVDGITDTGAEEVAQRVKSFTDNTGREGPKYVNPRIIYVSQPTELAIAGAAKRLKKAKTPSDRRMIPEVIMRAVHRDVSATIPGVMANAKEMGADVQVWDTNQGRDEVTGQKNDPKLVAHASSAGQTHLPDSNGYQRILDKAQEGIAGVPDVTVPPSDIWKAGGQNVSIDPKIEKDVGKGVINALPQVDNKVKLPQPTGDPQKLMALAEARGLPAYQKLLNLGRGIISKLTGGQTQDISEGKDFKQVGADIQANMDKPHVIIAPVKSLRRALEKAEQDGTANNLSQVHDLNRATITVPTAQDLPDAINKITAEAEKQGWTVERTKPRLVNENGNNRSDENGYGDTSLILRGPKDAGGMTAELQVNTNPMWWTKEIGPGHAYYELERQITGRALAEQRKATTEEEALVAEIQKAAKPLYDRAWGASLHGGGTDNIERVVMGDEAEQARAKAELETLRQKTAALMGSAPTPTSQRGRRPRAS